jgi:hypothetical protein
LTPIHTYESLKIHLEVGGYQMTLWILLMAIYVAPADAVDHKGSWAYDSLKQRGAFVSEADCIVAGEEFRQELGQMMRIPFVTT